MRLFLPVLHLGLAALVLVSALGLGIARGQAPVAGHAVICGSFGIQSVAVDAEGNVLTAPGHCPDCAGMLLGAVAQAPAVVPDYAALKDLRGCGGSDLAAEISPGHGVPPVRAPPVGTQS